MAPRSVPARLSIRYVLLAAALGLPTLASHASAQVTAEQLTSAATGPKDPMLLRADSPGGTYNPNDPSLRFFYGATMDGVNLDGVARIESPDVTPGFTDYCTGTRIGARAVITAAHCVTDENTGKITDGARTSTVARFIGPGAGGVGSAFYNFTASGVFVQSSFQGFYNPATLLYQDVAVLTFDTDLPSFITTYNLFDNGILGSQTPTGLNTVNAGYGTFGSGAGATGFDGRRRAGNNVVDFVANDPTGDDYGVLYTSFQDANDNYNSVCGVYGAGSSFCHASRGATEAGTAPGDSGGPLFINGQLAGVVSFGTYFCADSACNPYMSGDPTRPTNAYGALNGYAPVSANRAFIEGVLATPEPSSIALVAVGMAGVASMATRRRRES